MTKAEVSGKYVKFYLQNGIIQYVYFNEYKANYKDHYGKEASFIKEVAVGCTIKEKVLFG